MSALLGAHQNGQNLRILRVSTDQCFVQHTEVSEITLADPLDSNTYSALHL